MESLSAEFLKYSEKHLSGIPPRSVAAVLALTAEGGTVPFIARYRKEKTGNLDEVQIQKVIDGHERFETLQKRKAFVLEEIESQGNMTDELRRQIAISDDLAEIEEIYRPFKKKKKTKAKIAMDAGLGPLADWILAVGAGTANEGTSLEVKAKDFIQPDKGFATYEECLRGAQHIIVEKLANTPELRALVKDDFQKNGLVLTEKGKDYKANSKFSMYENFKEPVKSLQTSKASHRYLALRRGWHEGELKVTIQGNAERLLQTFEQAVVKKPGTQADGFLRLCAKAALDVHVVPSVSNEIHSHLKELSDLHAIEVFADNVKKVLMGSPFGAKIVLGVDPGLRTGCKVALVDQSGRFLTSTVLHIQGSGAEEKAQKLFGESLKQMTIEAIAVGNGTGGREAETFIRKALKTIGRDDVPVVMVSESGASVYSASEVARDEFPDLDITVRGAISIARRLQDPLSELVKVDPKSIGVGQYQHDVNQGDLKKALHRVVESSVNSVGVDVNTASVSLLQYVAGIGPTIAKNIVGHRGDKGLFKERSELMKVANFGSKAFEQAAGFLRIRGGRNPFDQTGIHPERYQAVQDMLKESGLNLSDVLGKSASPLQGLKEKWSKLVGEYTFNDIVTELTKPGRDPRDPFKVFKFREDIHEVKDLKEGMICPGLVTNVTNFGAFVDIGVHQDGLVHISQIAHDFVSDPKTKVSPGDAVDVKVLGVDLEKNQISLTMILTERPQRTERAPRAERPPRGERGPRDGRQQAARQPEKRQPSGGRQQDRRPPQKPFNNPFAALAELKKS
jgi:protein Tex